MLEMFGMDQLCTGRSARPLTYLCLWVAFLCWIHAVREALHLNGLLPRVMSGTSAGSIVSGPELWRRLQKRSGHVGHMGHECRRLPLSRRSATQKEAISLPVVGRIEWMLDFTGPRVVVVPISDAARFCGELGWACVAGEQ